MSNDSSIDNWHMRERCCFVGFNVGSPCACACNVVTLIQIQAVLLLKAKHRTHILKRLPQSVQSHIHGRVNGSGRNARVMSHEP